MTGDTEKHVCSGKDPAKYHNVLITFVSYATEKMYESLSTQDVDRTYSTETLETHLTKCSSSSS